MTLNTLERHIDLWLTYSDAVMAVAIFRTCAASGPKNADEADAVDREFERQMYDLVMCQGVWEYVGDSYCPDL